MHVKSLYWSLGETLTLNVSLWLGGFNQQGESDCSKKQKFHIIEVSDAEKCRFLFSDIYFGRRPIEEGMEWNYLSMSTIGNIQ